MSLTGDIFDFQYYLIENCLYWKSSEKTLLTLNTMLMGFVGALPLLFISLRYVVVLGMWGFVAMHSPFFMALAQAIVQILIEYGIVFERKTPVLMTQFYFRLEHVYIPRVKYFMSWVPYANRYFNLEIKESTYQGQNLSASIIQTEGSEVMH